MFLNEKMFYYFSPCENLVAGSRKSRQLNKKQCGRSMIEMLGVLAIVGILSAGGIAGYSMAMQSHKTNTLIENIQLVNQKAREFYKGDYSELSSDNNWFKNMVRSGLIADKGNPFGGNFILRRKDDKTFLVVLSQLPTEACVKMLSTNWGGPGTFEAVWIANSSSQETGFFAYDEGTYPPSVSDITAACGNGGNMKMHLRFK